VVLSRILLGTMGRADDGYESVEETQAFHSTLVSTFRTGKTKDIAWRKWQLKQLWWLVDENEQAIVDAIKSDLNRPGFETYLTDLAGIRKDILYHLENIDAWAADEPLGDSFVARRLGVARIRKEPLGVVLIIGAWNFPVLLVLQPLIAAITAGCCAIIKPSELTTACQTLLRELFTQYLDSSAIRVVCGGVDETTKLLEFPFNHIFFTGSASVGRHISAAAAKHLTPVTLELGGQSPAIIGKSADLDRAAKTVAFSKFLNAGQICLAVNHVFVDPAVHDTFVERLKHWSSQFLHGEPKITTAIVNQRHCDRLSSLLKQTKGTVVCGGGESDELCRMKPTVVTDLDIDGKLPSTTPWFG
jgi:aldehyde dehydrogenase (NAD+)